MAIQSRSTAASFVADVANLEAIRRFVRKQFVAAGLDAQAVYDMVLAVDELATNTIEHGYQSERGSIELEVIVGDDGLSVHLRDRAPAFDPTLAPTPDITIPLEKRSLGGMGIHLARNLADEINYRRSPDGMNEVTLVKRMRIKPKQEDHRGT